MSVNILPALFENFSFPTFVQKKYETRKTHWSQKCQGYDWGVLWPHFLGKSIIIKIIVRLWLEISIAKSMRTELRLYPNRFLNGLKAAKI